VSRPVLEEVGIDPPSYPTVKRRLPVIADESWRKALVEASAAHTGLGPASLVLYDVKRALSRDRRWLPTITAVDPHPTTSKTRSGKSTANQVHTKLSRVGYRVVLTEEERSHLVVPVGRHHAHRTAEDGRSR
jgi:hypothetical protein